MAPRCASRPCMRIGIHAGPAAAEVPGSTPGSRVRTSQTRVARQFRISPDVTNPSRIGEKSIRSRGRNGSACSTCRSSKCIPRSNAPTRRKESAFNRKTASRPSSAGYHSTQRRSDRQTKRQVAAINGVGQDHIFLSGNRWDYRSPARLEKKPNPASRRKAKDRPATNHLPRAHQHHAQDHTMRIRSAAIMTCLRRSRSFTTPAMGAIRVLGQYFATPPPGHQFWALPVNSRIRP